MEQEKISDKIIKLLALSESENEHEAQSAMVMAQKLLAKYNLDMKDVQDTKKKADVIESKTERFSHNWKIDIGWIIAKNFRCESYFVTRKSKQFVFVGLKDDVEIAIAVYEFAVRSIEKLIKKWFSEVRQDSLFPVKQNLHIIRLSVVDGFKMGMQERFELSKSEMIKESQSFAMVIQIPQEVTDYFSQFKLKERKDMPKTNVRIQEIMDDGYEEGYNFAFGKLIED